MGVRSAPEYTSSRLASRAGSVVPSATTSPPTIGMIEGDESRRGSPVRRSDGERLAAGIVGREKPTIHREDPGAGSWKRGAHGVEDEPDALALRPEHLRELGGHGDCVAIVGRRSNLVRERAQKWSERLGVALDLEGACAGGNQGSVDDAGHLRVDAANVPSNY